MRLVHAPRARLVRTLAVVLTLSSLVACKEAAGRVKRQIGGKHPRTRAAWSPATLSAVQGVPVEAIKTAINARLEGKAPFKIEDEAWHHTKNLYKNLGQTPLWLTNDGLAKERASALSNAVLNLSQDGLRLDQYPIVELANALMALRQTRTPTAEQLADADVLLSAMYSAVGEDLLSGQVNPKDVAQAWHIDPTDENVDSALVQTLGELPFDAAINALRPEDDEYAALQKELVNYRAIVEKGGWPAVPSGKATRPGQSDSPARLGALRQRLALEGIAVDSTVSGTYTEAMGAAVAEFQSRHAIVVDTSLNKETIEALNVPAAYRLGQIAANLERYRWMPRSLGSRYVYVNVPAFHLVAYDSGQATLDMKVIVGQEFEDKATPVFSDSMETVVFRPYWNITPDIQSGEVEPKAAADPGYLDRQNMEYYTDGGVRRIRQKPGGKNSLGLVKFLFPNDFNIYLHDTPNHELFAKDVRAFSHGCIRVEKPGQLAQWVLGWDAARVTEAMNSGADNHSVRLPKKLPVYITYATTFMRDGRLNFGNDLYHRDEKLVQAMSGGALPGESTVRALQTLKKIAES